MNRFTRTNTAPITGDVPSIDIKKLIEILDSKFPDITSFELHIHRDTKININSYGFMWYRQSKQQYLSERPADAASAPIPDGVKCICEVRRTLDPMYRAHIRPIHDISYVSDLLAEAFSKDRQPDHIEVPIFGK
jgi:hypothetical protein